MLDVVEKCYQSNYSLRYFFKVCHLLKTATLLGLNGVIAETYS